LVGILKIFAGDFERFHHPCVPNDLSTKYERAAGEFGVSRRSDFSDDEEIQRGMKPLRDLISKGNTSTRERHNQWIREHGVSNKEIP
jgi:hypothetical protein